MLPAQVSDRELRKRVKTALKHTKGLKALDTAVRARNGQVTLQGYVRTQQEVDLAYKVAKSVPGVVSVKNSLTVNRPTDSWR